MSSTPSKLLQSARQSIDTVPVNVENDLTSKSLPPDTQTLNLEANLINISNARRYFLLFLFAMAQFMDVYSASAIVVAIPSIARELEMTLSESTWLVNAYSLTLAAFLLTGGRVSDIWSSKWVFVIGFAWVGIFSLGIGFVRDKTTMFVLRAISGIGAALTIPSALSLIVHLFPEPKEQAIAISIFGGSGAIANVAGLILGGALLLADWTWIFYFVAIVVLPLSLAAAILIPAPPAVIANQTEKDLTRRPKMDYLGTLLLTAAIVLTIYGLTEGSTRGWKSASTLSTLIIGVLLFPVFLVWESYMDPIDALIAPAMWSIQNFILITIISLAPYFWWFATQVGMTAIFQELWKDSSILAAVRIVPSAVPAFFVLMLLGRLPLSHFPLRWRLVTGAVLAAAGALLLSFAKEESDYWRLVFPGFFIGSSGCATVYVSANIALVMAVDPKDSGVAGGVFNSVLQLGTAVGLAITSTIQTTFHEPGSTVTSHKGYQSAFLFVMATMLVVVLLTLVGFRDPVVGNNLDVEPAEKHPSVDQEATFVSDRDITQV